jgi:hypothetical protein
MRRMQSIRGRVAAADQAFQEKKDQFALERQELLRTNRRLEQDQLEAHDAAQQAIKKWCVPL